MLNRRLAVLYRAGSLLLTATIGLCGARPAPAKDYFITLGGGYSREGNQASLEANVVFFKQVLKDKHPEPLRDDIFFAHGDDSAADVQVVADNPKASDSPATDLLASLYRRSPNRQLVTYRTHRVTELAGALAPQLIQDDLEKLAKSATPRDRLIIYVTSHGGPGDKDDPFDTSIDCWDGKKITAREFSHWLDKLPAEMPVVMVMAQCYCGGFGRLIFDDLDESKGFTKHARVGFFAQRHDLPAAGCRPDIEHDEEFSSYFWGAIEGHRRSGAKIDDCDLDGDGVVSFAEAYAYAVTADDTIDIPLRTSEVFLRKYSRLEDAQADSDSGDGGDRADADKADQATRKADPKPAKDDQATRNADPKPKKADSTHPAAKPAAKPAAEPASKLAPMNGTLRLFVARGDRISARIVTQLAKTLGFKLDDDVSVVRSAAEGAGRGGPPRRPEARPRPRSGLGPPRAAQRHRRQMAGPRRPEPLERIIASEGGQPERSAGRDPGSAELETVRRSAQADGDRPRRVRAARAALRQAPALDRRAGDDQSGRQSPPRGQAGNRRAPIGRSCAGGNILVAGYEVKRGQNYYFSVLSWRGRPRGRIARPRSSFLANRLTHRSSP